MKRTWQVKGSRFALQWTFSYIGFPVELNTVYFIGAQNIPNANMNEDGPSMAVNFTSPGTHPHSCLILCLAGTPDLVCGLVETGQVPWMRCLALLSLGFLMCTRDTATASLTRRGLSQVKQRGKPIPVHWALTEHLTPIISLGLSKPPRLGQP